MRQQIAALCVLVWPGLVEAQTLCRPSAVTTFVLLVNPYRMYRMRPARRLHGVL